MKASAVIGLIVVLAIAIGSPVISMGAEDADWQKVVAAAKKEGTVVAASSTFEGEAAVAAMKAFKDRYGISLEFIPGRMVTATEKIVVEQKSKSYITDCIDTYGTSTILLKKGGYLDKVPDLPALKEKDKFNVNLITPDGLMLNIAGMSSNLYINTNEVKPGQEPKSYQDLLDPKWKGKIYLLNPIHNSGPDQVFAGFTLAGILKEDYFIKLYKSAIIGGPAGGQEMTDKLVRGEVSVAGFAGTSGLKEMQAGAPIKPLDLKEGRLTNYERLVAIKNAPHPNALKVYMNWVLSQEAQTIVSKLCLMEPVRSDLAVKPFVTFKNPKVILSPEGLELSEKNRSDNYLANKIGIKR